MFPFMFVPQKKRTHKGCVRVVRTKGLAPLAARPARQLSIAAFAIIFILIQASQGKAFCSHKTAPTLKSLRIRAYRKIGDTLLGHRLFFV